MKIRDIEINTKKTIRGYFEDYCNDCPYMDNEIVGFENLSTSDQKTIYRCKNQDLCERLYKYHQNLFMMGEKLNE